MFYNSSWSYRAVPSPTPSSPTDAHPQLFTLLAERRDDGDRVRAGGGDGRRRLEGHAADGDERRVAGHEAAPDRDALEAARREGNVLGRRADSEHGPDRDVRCSCSASSRYSLCRSILPRLHRYYHHRLREVEFCAQKERGHVWP